MGARPGEEVPAVKGDAGLSGPLQVASVARCFSHAALRGQKPVRFNVVAHMPVPEKPCRHAVQVPTRLLMGPGPSNSHPRVLLAQGQPMLGDDDVKFLVHQLHLQVHPACDAEL